MQAMMGRIGMGDWQMRGAYEGKMEGMDMGDMKGMPMGDMKGMEGMQGMKGMENMPGMKMEASNAMTGAGTHQAGGLSLTLNTAPQKPTAGNVMLKLKLNDQAGKPVTNAQVVFVYTMPMPGMTDSKAAALHTKDGLYEGTVLFGMGGTWVVTVNVTVPGRPAIAEKYQFSVAGGGM
jgi:Cu(I)/Ag(I) efflux system membrane fusion protein